MNGNGEAFRIMAGASSFKGGSYAPLVAELRQLGDKDLQAILLATTKGRPAVRNFLKEAWQNEVESKKAQIKVEVEVMPTEVEVEIVPPVTTRCPSSPHFDWSVPPANHNFTVKANNAIRYASSPTILGRENLKRSRSLPPKIMGREVEVEMIPAVRAQNVIHSASSSKRERSFSPKRMEREVEVEVIPAIIPAVKAQNIIRVPAQDETKKNLQYYRVVMESPKVLQQLCNTYFQTHDLSRNDALEPSELEAALHELYTQFSMPSPGRSRLPEMLAEYDVRRKGSLNREEFQAFFTETLRRILASCGCMPTSSPTQKGHLAHQRLSSSVEEPMLIFVLGGRGKDMSFLDSVEVLDTTQKIGAEVAPGPFLPEARFGSAAAVIADKLYVVGGRGSDNSSLSRVDVLNVKESWVDSRDCWTDGPLMTVGRLDPGLAVRGNCLYVLGGDGTGDIPLDCTEVLDTNKRKWSEGPRLKQARAGPGAVVFGEQLYALGGRSQNLKGSEEVGFKSLSSVEVLDPLNDKQWKVGPSLSTPRYLPAVVAMRESLFVVGGSPDGGFSVLNTVEVLDQGSPVWQQATPMSLGRMGPAVCVVSDRIYILGGRIKGCQPTAQTEVYDHSMGTWSAGPELSEARIDPCAVAV